MADRDVTVDIIANDKTDRGVTSAERNFTGLDRRVKKSSTDRNRSMEKDAKKSISIFEGLFGGLIKQGQKAGFLAGTETLDSFSAVFKALPPEVKAGMAASLAGAAVLAAPAIVATTEAAILAGVGAGGLAAGIALAAKDPQVIAAYTNLGQRVSSRLQDAAKPFRSELIATAGIAEQTFGRIVPRIDRMFAGLASTVRPLASGLAKGIENAFPGLEHAVQASLPLLRDLAGELPKIGTLVGDLFDAVAKGGPGAAQVFHFILINIEALIYGLTELINELGGAANGFAVLNSKASLIASTLAGHPLEAYAVQLKSTSAAASSAGFTFNGMAVATYNTAEAATAANAAFRSLFGELMSVDQANLAVATGMANLRNTIKGNSKTLDENTEAGRQNVGAILQQIRALEQKRQADIAAGNGTKTATDKANAAYAAQVASLRQVLITMGLTASEVDNLIAKYQSIPRNITTTITTTYRTNGTPQQGHSRYQPGSGGFDSLDGWRPAQFAQSRAGQFAMFGPGQGSGRTIKPYQLQSNVDVAVLLDGEPVRKVAKTVSAEEADRRDWRAKVGTR